MKEPTRIIAIRHGETAWNVDTRIQGHLDVPLNARGQWQAEQLGRALVGEPLAAIYSSDLSRAHETASQVARHTGAELNVEPRLRERSFGSFEGKTFAEIESTLPQDAQRWRQRDPHFVPEGGESLTQLQERVVHIASTLAARHPGQLIAMVSHGGVMDVLYRAATRLDLKAARTWALGNAAINRLLWSPQGFTLVGWADTGHLQEPVSQAATVRDETST